MERFLKGGAELNIAEKGVFQIKDEIGRGASCIVYLAEYVDDEGNHIECLLKEYNPKNIVLYREESGELCLDSEEDRGAFEQGLARFEEGYQKQISFRRELPGLKNETSNVQRIHSANGTKYIEMTCNEGSSYEKVQEASLHDLLCRIKELARIIGNYHNAGLLHLDIKPQNIFSVPGKCETVLLFDFDSVVSKEDVLSAHVLSCTQTWAAPEQIARRRDSICEATDIFAIGAILFAKIYGYPPEDENKRSFAKYTFDYEAELFKNVNPKVYKLLEEILHRTICRPVKERYQSTEELIAVLDEAIKLADPKEPYLKSSLPAIQNFFVGRDSEIEEIHKRLNENNVLFISGVGGIGKSELVKNYAKKYREEYDAVIFAPFVSGIMSMVADEKKVPVYNFFSYEEEKIEDYYERKLAKIKELSDTRTLLIVDNLDTEDEKIQDVLGLGCNILVSTRRDFSEYGYEQMNIAALQDKQAVFAVFNNYYTRPLSEEDREKVGQIIDLVDGHTMTVELLAKQMMAGRVTPAKMLEKLQGGMHASGREKVKSGKDGLLANRSAYEHIQALFDLSGLTDEEKYILGNLSLLPHTGVPTELFHSWCELEDYDAIEGLAASGWARIEEVLDYISLHPVVAEVASELVKGKTQLSVQMLEGIVQNERNGVLGKSGITEEGVADFFVAVSFKVMKYGLTGVSVISFLEYAYNVFFTYGNFSCSMESRKYILSESISLFGNISKETAEAHFKLASTAIGYLMPRMGKEHLEKAKAICTDLDMEKDILMADIQFCFGQLYTQEKDYELAEECLLSADQIRLSQSNPNVQLGWSINFSLGHIYIVNGLFPLARKYYALAEECLEEDEEIKKIFFPITQRGLDFLVNKEQISETNIESMEKILLECEHNTDWSSRSYDILELYSKYISIAIYYMQHSKWHEALFWYKKMSDIEKKLFGDTDVRLVSTYESLARVAFNLKDWKEAESNCWNILELLKDIEASENSKCAVIYHMLADIYSENNDLDKAILYEEKSLEIKKLYFGNDHIKLCSTYMNLGWLHYEKDNVREVEENYCNMLEIYIMQQNADISKLVVEIDRMAVMCFRSNNQEMVDLFAKIVNTYSQKVLENFELNRDEFVHIYRNLALVSKRIGNDKDLECYINKVRDTLSLP